MSGFFCSALCVWGSSMCLFVGDTFYYLFFKRFYLFIVRGEGRGRNIEVGEKHQLVASHTPPLAPNQGPGLKPRHVPWPGIEPVTFCFAGQRPTHWATLVRAVVESFLWHPTSSSCIAQLMTVWVASSLGLLRIMLWTFFCMFLGECRMSEKCLHFSWEIPRSGIAGHGYDYVRVW